ncbi:MULTISPECIES: MFS transporter [Kitasatospora]|uniref:Putative drug resistance protein n=1 Tax=Kitasatospora setae (strain ATCC 33774 / DSM 43861 / JCM 3304 / KCC A-0304 / NBRC 14216 / KM-6054) TaxID=452652 RepID=E4NIL3_KITSK|nr:MULTISPECIES: MFS transporter [Kitasatospora]BAJ32811.1 putative drug resistance protein [Kitasatospora setae KM-6054]
MSSKAGQAAQPTAEPPVASDAPGPDPKRWLALAVLLVATFMDLLDVNIVTVAIPTVQSDLGASAVVVQAVTAGYTLAFAAVLITGGRLGDIFGRKRMFMTGVAGFVLSSALCAAAQSSEMLVGGRILQGVTAAIMVPQVLAIIHVSFDPKEIGRVVALYAGMIGLAIVAAPILGGVLVDWSPFDLGWRAVFVVNLPVGVAALVGASRWMRESKSPHAMRLDLIGMLLAIVGLLLLMLPLMLGRELDWPAWSIICLVAAVPVLVGFVFYERYKTRKDGSPLVILSLFKVRAFGAGVAAQMLFSTVPAGFFLSWTLYLQGGLGWSALHTGLTAIPFSLGVPIVGTIAVRTLHPRYGRHTLVAGAVAMMLGVGSYAWIANRAGDGITSWHAVPSMLLLGSGMGLLMAPLTGLILREVKPQEAGAASGIINATGQLGAALGVAIIGGIFFSALASNAGPQADKVIPTVRAVAPAQAGAIRACATDSLGQADLTKVPESCTTLLASTSGTSQDAGPGADAKTIGHTLDEIRSKTFIATYSTALYWAAGALVLVTGLLFLLPHRTHRPEKRQA